MNKAEQIKFFEESEKRGKVSKLVYYSHSGKCTFYVPTLDESGKKIQKTHGMTGAPMYLGNKPLYADQMEQFQPVVTNRSSKADALSFKSVESDENGVFTPYQKTMVEVLEGMADNESSQVKRENDWKRDKNPEAWGSEQKFQKLLKEHESKVELAHDLGKKEAAKEFTDEIDALKKQLADAEKALSDKSAHQGGQNQQQQPHQGGNRR